MGSMDWRSEFDERQLKEIEFCILYATNFKHGTDGHNAKMIIAKMVELLDCFKLGSEAGVF